MAGSLQKAARVALDGMRPAVDRLARETDPALLGAGIVEAWSGAENTLRTLMGGSGADLAGQGLVRELRSRGLLALDEAHSLIDFQAAADRSRQLHYTPSAADVAAARTGYDRLVDVVERDGAPPSATSASSGTGVSAEMPVEQQPPGVTPRRNVMGRVLVAVALLVVVGAGGWFIFTRVSGAEPGDVRRGREAFAAGDRVGARAAFTTAAARNPALATPHIYLGRMAREEGDFTTANNALRTAVTIEPENALAHRELAALLLATNQLELARSFYERAIRLDPEDRNALGFMGCTLARMGRFDLAPRFLQRAGAGSWQQCAQQAMIQPPAAPTP
ncbi:MAG: tetratricopeptide repeat protein [Gemmatimonadota bacterium]